jgi:hypothetical protein
MPIAKTLLANISLALLSAALTVSSAGAQDIVSYEPPCREALKRSPDAFSDLFVEKTNDGSEAGLDQAATYWANCKHDANLVRLKAFPALKARLTNLYLLEWKFIVAETELASLVSGGGTMYPHGAARFGPTVELHMEKLIALTTSKAGALQSPSITARYANAKKKLEARLKRVQTPKPYVDGYGKADADAKRREWLGFANNYNQAYLNIFKTIGSRVDATSVVVMEFLANGLWAEEL